MEWRTCTVLAELGPLTLCCSAHGDYWGAYAHLVVGAGVDELRACEILTRNNSIRLGSLAEAQAAAHAFAEQLGPVEPWLALLGFFRFDRDRPTPRRLATARVTLRRARKRKAAA